MAKGETWKRWADENTKVIQIRFNLDNDVDILGALERRAKARNESMSATIKGLLRVGIKCERYQK